MTPVRQEPTGRACPRCHRRTDRIARRWFDRCLGLFMPVLRYRCASAGCGWEGLLLRHRRRRMTAAAYRPRWLDWSRMDKPPRE